LHFVHLSSPVEPTLGTDLGGKRDIGGVHAGSIDVLEFGPFGFCVGLDTILFGSEGIKEKTGMGFIENQSGDIRILRDPRSIYPEPTTYFEDAPELKAVLTKVKEHTRTINTILLKGILCLS